MLFQILSVLIFITLCTSPGQAQRCTTPNNGRGFCRSLYECGVLYRLLENLPLSDESTRFLRESQCTRGTGRPPYVCCGRDNRYILTPATGTGRQRTIISPSNGQGNILPRPGICGSEPPGNKIYQGTDTALDEYPWMALLEYREANGKRDFPCGGVLINQRYVLTVAHCLKGEIVEKKGQLISVRLGEYNTETDIDCIQIDNNQKDCAPPPLNIGIEQIIPHENFLTNDINRYNDIGLIRLASDIQYSDFIKPICIPSVTLRSNVGIQMTVSGWGRTLKAKKSAIKQKLNLEIANFNDCKRQFSTKRVSLRDSQICAGGKFAEDTCDGDSGGPLMRISSNYWFVEGLVSFGNLCGQNNWPGIYTRVNSHLDWIRRNLRQ